MPEADDDLLFTNAFDNVGFGLIGIIVAADRVKRVLIGATMLRPLQRANRAADR
jgi:hypothetical protein